MPEIIHHRSSIIRRRGIALLAVLFIIMAITVLSLGFLARSDTELACGQNMALRVETDQLAASGLEHARGLILDPQELKSEYWTGGTGLRLVSGGSDSYDVTVAPVVSNPNDHCTYSITCDAYQTKSGQKLGESRLSAQLRLDPAIALWTGAATTLTSGLTLYGDVRCGGSLSNYGTIDGDVFATALPVSGTKTGQLNPQALSLNALNVTVQTFTDHWVTDTIDHSTLGHSRGPYDPPHVFSYSRNVTVGADVVVQGMLLVDGDLTISGHHLTTVAGKNLAALYVTRDLKIEDGGSLDANGLVIVGRNVLLAAGAGPVHVTGALFTNGTFIETVGDSSADEYAYVCGAPTWHPSGGRIGGALQFDGVDDYLRTPDDSHKLQLSWPWNCTFSVWIYADPIQQAEAGILSKCDSGGTKYYWALRLNSATPREIIACPEEDVSWTSPWSTGIFVTDLTGGWHHIAVVREGSCMTSYVDGLSRKSEDLDRWGWGGIGWWWPASGPGHLNIGTDRTAHYMYKGLLDDVRVYSAALHSDDVEKLAGKIAGAPGHSSNLIGHWTFDERGAQMVVSADPEKAAIVTWPNGVPTNWSPAAGAFFKQISRVTP